MSRGPCADGNNDSDDRDDMHVDVPVDTGAPTSETATITRGVCRLFADMDYRVLAELSLGNGRRVDVAAIGRTGSIAIVEVKSCLADFRADDKWRDYLAYCDRFYFAVAPAFPQRLLPLDTGIVVADEYHGGVVRDAPNTPMNAARRKAVTVRFARTAAARLQDLCDRHPGGSWAALRPF